MKTPHATFLLAALVPTLAACGSSKSAAAGDAGAEAGPVSFEACVAALQPNCSVADQTTAAQL